MKNIIEEHFNQSSLTINSLKKPKKINFTKLKFVKRGPGKII